MNNKLTPIQTGIMITGLITAFIHAVYLNIAMDGIDVMFTLNGLGYIALLGAYFLPAFKKYHAPIRWLFIGYTAITIIAWFILGNTGWWVGWVTKLDEIALIGLLFADKPA